MIYPNNILDLNTVQLTGPTNNVMELTPSRVVSLAEDMEIYSVNDLRYEQAIVYVVSPDLFYTMQQNDHPFRHLFEPTDRVADIERGHLGYLFGKQVLCGTFTRGPFFAALLIEQQADGYKITDHRCYQVAPQGWQTQGWQR